MVLPMNIQSSPKAPRNQSPPALALTVQQTEHVLNTQSWPLRRLCQLWNKQDFRKQILLSQSRLSSLSPALIFWTQQQAANHMFRNLTILGYSLCLRIIQPDWLELNSVAKEVLLCNRLKSPQNSTKKLTSNCVFSILKQHYTYYGIVGNFKT